MKTKIDLNRVKRECFSLGIVLFLTACGGGSSSNNITSTTKDTNNAPTISITTKSSSVFEGMSVELNATATDDDNDTLTYSWTQKSGESVSLINATSANPSFIAPDVSEDSNFSFELEVTDGKVNRATKVSVNVIDVPKANKYHEVIPTTTAVSASNGSVTIKYNYNKKPITEITSGLVLNVYWDDSKLEYKSVLALLNKDYIGVSSLKDDSSNDDSDISTNKYITISWVNLANGNWEVPTPLPTALFSITMKRKTGQKGTTTLNIKTNVPSPKLDFYSQSVLIDLGN